MHGSGNDFILINCLAKNELKNPSAAAKKLCDRHFGIGADGLILVLKSKKADFMMRIYNPDGSEAEMCGNGIRCFAKYVLDKKLINRKNLKIETMAGIREVEAISSQFRVDMGKPSEIRQQKINLKEKTITATCLSMGNPHCVVFVDESDFDVKALGWEIENHKLFPKRTNVEFVKVKNKNSVEAVVWERGAGLTLACGTGACAVAVASVRNGKTGKNVYVMLPGGRIKIEWAENNHVYMTGPAETIFEGAFSLV